jgi:hypothetical protein
VALGSLACEWQAGRKEGRRSDDYAYASEQQATSGGIRPSHCAHYVLHRPRETDALYRGPRSLPARRKSTPWPISARTPLWAVSATAGIIDLHNACCLQIQIQEFICSCPTLCGSTTVRRLEMFTDCHTYVTGDTPVVPLSNHHIGLVTRIKPISQSNARSILKSSSRDFTVEGACPVDC